MGDNRYLPGARILDGVLEAWRGVLVLARRVQDAIRRIAQSGAAQNEPGIGLGRVGSVLTLLARTAFGVTSAVSKSVETFSWRLMLWDRTRDPLDVGDYPWLAEDRPPDEEEDQNEQTARFRRISAGH